MARVTETEYNSIDAGITHNPTRNEQIMIATIYSSRTGRRPLGYDNEHPV